MWWLIIVIVAGILVFLAKRQSAQITASWLQAVESGNCNEIEKVLYSRNAQETYLNRTDKDGRNAMILAVVHGHTQVVKLLFRYVASINSYNSEFYTHKDNYGRDALMYAMAASKKADYSYPDRFDEIVKLLLPYCVGSADLPRDKAGYDAIMLAEKANRFESAELVKTAVQEAKERRKKERWTQITKPFPQARTQPLGLDRRLGKTNNGMKFRDLK